MERRALVRHTALGAAALAAPRLSPASSEYTRVPRERVLPIRTDLSWDVLAALPETWLTAWGSLVEAMAVEAGRRC